MNEKILITGAGGYVGTALVDHLLRNGFQVKALDTFWFSKPLISINKNLEIIKADLRNVEFEKIMEDIDKVVHLAAISNDPSYELSPGFSEEINYYATIRLLDACKLAKVSRFIFASSSSVYGIKMEDNVTEDLSTFPLTDYSKSKERIEQILRGEYFNNFDYVILRPATICGPSPRMRLDIIGNMFSAQGFFNKKITIHGGDQNRAQIHIMDLIRAYEMCLLDQDDFKGAIYNISEKNYKVSEIANDVMEILNQQVELEFLPILDTRSYRINADKIKNERGFQPMFSCRKAIEDNINYFHNHKNINWQDEIYHNIKMMKKIIKHEL